MASNQVWTPVPESLEYDLITAAMHKGEVPLPYRLCQLVDAPAAVTLPEGVRQAIVEVTNWVADWTEDGDDGFDTLAAACHAIYRWLDAQPRTD